MMQLSFIHLLVGITGLGIAVVRIAGATHLPLAGFESINGGNYVGSSFNVACRRCWR